MKRSLAILETKLGRNHPDVAQSLNDLGTFYLVNGHYAEAEPLFKRLLEMQEANLGKDVPYLSLYLDNLGVLYHATGRYAEAEPMYKKSLEICEAKLGKDHPDVAKPLGNLSFLYAATEKYALSEQYLYRSITIDEKARENMFLFLNEKQKLGFVNRTKGSMEALLQLASQHPQKDINAILDTMNAWLRWKGVVTESQGRITEACSRAEKPEVVKKCDELTEVRRTLASLLYARPEKIDADNYRETLTRYNQKKNDLEAELNDLSKDFSLEKQVGRVDIAAISSILPKESAYLDFAVVAPHDFKDIRFEEKPCHCLVFILTPGDQPRVALVDLGNSEAIDRHIQEYHKVIREAVSRQRPPDKDKLRQHLKALYRLVMEPLLPHIEGRKQLFVSPDGSLNLIPFEAFVTPEGKYLMEGHSIQYIAAGRDIVRFKDTAQPQAEALIMADPDYKMGDSELIGVAKSLGLEVQEEPGVLSQEDRAMSFEGLEGAGKQAEEIRKLIGGVIYSDKKALQEVLFAVQYPRVLHIATHGYFLPVKKIPPQLSLGKASLPSESLKGYENPMIRSGIALAGANTSLRGRVTAEKLVGLRLKGTDLVVLSACQTGVGDVQTSEGVFGLKRAFILSGARTVVMSLWSVPSEETTQLMVSFYSKWVEGKKSKADALREAKLELMKQNPNPFFWGAFVMVGDPGKAERRNP